MILVEININPKPAPRPRKSKIGHFYNPTDYTKYKEKLEYFIEKKKIPKDDYGYIFILFVFPYPEKTSLSKRVNGALMRKRCDADNLSKPIMDTLQKCGIIENDSRFYYQAGLKLYTNEDVGKVVFFMF